MLGLGVPPAEQLSTIRYPTSDWTHCGGRAVKYGGWGEIESLACGGGGDTTAGRSSGLGPKLMSSYSTQFLVLCTAGTELSAESLWGMVTTTVDVASRGIGLSLSLERLTIALISFPCCPALLAATHLYRPSSAPETEEMIREPLGRME